MNVSLTPALARYVESLVRAGAFGSASEVVRETIRAYQDQQSDMAALREKLRRAAKQADEGRVIVSRVRLTHDALDDIDSIWLYIARDSERAADKFIAGVQDCLKQLARFPRLGRSRDELLPGVRSLVYYHHLIFYTIDGQTITVLRIVSGFRDLTVLLMAD
jgi:toxin ParE1/3/4